jgi:hypothetical protein
MILSNDSARVGSLSSPAHSPHKECQVDVEVGDEEEEEEEDKEMKPGDDEDISIFRSQFQNSHDYHHHHDDSNDDPLIFQTSAVRFATILRSRMTSWCINPVDSMTNGVKDIRLL